MIDFATLQGLTIPEGVVTQIADASGRVLWKLQSGGKVILEVEKITSDTYAGETAYTGEQFILLDIYPKTNGTVSVTYGGLTKTITDTSGAEEPNAQRVFFGTFNGVSDEVETPASGELTIDGDCVAFACSQYATNSKGIADRALCVTSITSLGGIIEIPDFAFSNVLTGCKIKSVSIPSKVKSIGECAFSYCTELATLTINNGLESIGRQAFTACKGLTSLIIPKSVTSISEAAFSECSNLTNLVVDDGNTCYTSDNGCLFSKDGTTLLFCGAVSGHYTVQGSVTRIGDCAFTSNDKVTSVTIPSSVTIIGDTVFHSCVSLESVTILATTPPALGEEETNVFYNTTCSIIVPAGCGEAYKAATNWQEYADRIVEAS